MPHPTLLGYKSGTLLQRTPIILSASVFVASAVYGVLFSFWYRFFLVQLLVPIAVLVLAVVWLLPDTNRPLGRGPEWLSKAMLFALFCWPDYLAFSAPGMPWITAMRLVTVPMALVMLISLSTSKRQRTTLKQVLMTEIWITRLLFAFIFLAVFSLLFSRNIDQTTSKLVILIFYGACPFLTACLAFSRPGSSKSIPYILIAILLFNFAIGLQEWRHQQVPWAGNTPSFLKIEDPTVQRILRGQSRAGVDIYRVQSKFSTSLGFAEFMAMVTPFIIHILVTERNRLIRAAMFPVLIMTFWFLVKTDSRLGMAGYLLAFMLYLFAWSFRRWRTKPGSMLEGLIVLSYPAIFGLFIAATLTVPSLQRMVWGGGQHQFSTNARADQYASGIPMVLSHPWGYGLGEGAQILGFVNLGGVLTIDTYFLAIALEVGIIGFFTFYGMILLTSVKSSLLSLNSSNEETSLLVPISIFFINFVVSKSVFSQTENHPLMFFMMGLSLALMYQIKQVETVTNL